MLPGNTDVAQLASGPCRVQMPYLTFPFRELCEPTHRHTVILHTAGQGLFSLKGLLVISLARMQKLGFQVGSYSSLKAEHDTLCLDYLSKQCVPCGAPAVPAGGLPACTTHFTTLLEEPSAAVGLGWRFPRPTAGARSSSSFLPGPVFPHWSKPLNHSSNQRLICTLRCCPLLDPTHLYCKHL